MSGARAGLRLTVELEPDVHVDASIGIGLSAEGVEQPRDLVRFSDVAMYHAKEETGTGYAFFDPDRDSLATRRLHRENELRRAVEADQFEIHYQPLITLPTGRVVGAEALVRWRHPDHGLLLPGEFIRLAEETGLILPLGKWVLRTAAGRAAAWMEEEVEGEFALSVNLSPRQFQDPRLVQEVEATLEETALPPDSLMPEITESMAV